MCHLFYIQLTGAKREFVTVCTCDIHHPIAVNIFAPTKYCRSSKCEQLPELVVLQRCFMALSVKLLRDSTVTRLHLTWVLLVKHSVLRGGWCSHKHVPSLISQAINSEMIFSNLRMTTSFINCICFCAFTLTSILPCFRSIAVLISCTVYGSSSAPPLLHYQQSHVITARRRWH